MMPLNQDRSCCRAKSWTLVIGILHVAFYVNAILGICGTLLSLKNKRSYYNQSVVHALIWGVLVYATMGLAASIQLIIGVQKRKSSYIFPFMTLFFHGLILGVAIAVGEIVFFFLNVSLGVTFIISSMMISFLYFNYYCYLKIEAFYRELVSLEAEQAPKLVYSYPPAYSPTVVMETKPIPY